jgi:hypothetical protein
MVESNSRVKINFIKLNQQELSSKIALLVSNKERIIFWKASPRYYEGRAQKFNIGQKIFLTLDNVEINLKIVGERICLNFSINDVDYFLRARVVEQDDNNQGLIFELEEECFRIEKRSRERLQAYPLYQIYSYIKYQKPKASNIVFFNKNEEKSRNFFSEIDNAKKGKLNQMAQDLYKDDDEDLIGFRVEDISSSGLSFFASSKEKEQILDGFGEEKFTMVLNFEMQVFNLEEANIVYKISYINPQFSGVPMYKIGVSFKPLPSLKRRIEELSGVTVDLVDYQKEFEEFIKNE